MVKPNSYCQKEKQVMVFPIFENFLVSKLHQQQILLSIVSKDN